MNYQVFIDKNASKVIDKLEKSLQSAIRKAIKQLEIEPRPFGYKKLVDADGLYRIKVKNYRIIYLVQDNLLLVSVVRVAKRNEDTY